MKPSEQFISLSLALLSLANFGFSIGTQAAQAQPFAGEYLADRGERDDDDEREHEDDEDENDDEEEGENEQGPQVSKYYHQGINKAERGDYQGAIRAFTQDLQIKPNAYAYLSRSTLYLVIGDYDRAIKDFEKSEELFAELDDEAHKIPVVLLASKDSLTTGVSKKYASLPIAMLIPVILRGGAIGVKVCTSRPQVCQENAKRVFRAVLKALSSQKPSAKECDTAIKILTQYERLAQKYGVKLSPKRISELNRKRDAGIITSYDLPATLREKFPRQFQGKTLNEVRKECGR